MAPGKKAAKKRSLDGKNKSAAEAKKMPKKEKVDDEDVANIADVKDEPAPVKKEKWTNRHRVMVFSSRGVTFRLRHLMKDVRTMLPHSKSETKMEKKERLDAINEICEMRNCQVCVYLEMKKHQDAYMWISATPNGPSVKFSLENIHTMQELRMTGNCLKGSRPIIAFGREFETEPHWRIIRELFAQVFNTPSHHPKSQPFIDHAVSLSIADNRVWFRNYQIVDEQKAALTEIGPRFTANPIAIFAGSFGGAVLWRNPHYVSPSLHRRALKIGNSQRSKIRYETKLGLKARLENPEESYPDLDVTDAVFNTKDDPAPKKTKIAAA